MPQPDPATTLRPRNAALTVRNLAQVAAFYRDVVGLRVLAEDPGRVVLGTERPLLTLLADPAALPDNPAAAGLFHLAFLLPARADLGHWLAHADRLSVALDGAADHLVSEAVYLHDPEGNGIEIYADRPAAAWRWTGDAGSRRVQMANARLDRDGLLRLPGPAWQGAPPGTVLGHVHLRVGDTATAAGFYGSVLGLDVTAQWPSATFLSSGGYHHHVGTNTWSSAGAGPRDPARAGLAWVALDADAPTAAAIAARTGTGPDLRDPWGTAIRIVTQPG